MFMLQFSSIGLPELLLILMIALLLFGTKRLPELGSSLGRAISEFKRGLSEEAPRGKLSENPERAPLDSTERRSDAPPSSP
ncbi:MAG: twin-arginine translocase TatA/TatE family subunit [Blastocatellia bacterium]|nr:twin-arginine translocase TatA/TatE family subunit [Blastocatellia bacterium]MCS7157053.1 twin-arginine translocase TatA/TatE family subunit [Blastocatellia bacterium]MCX7752254.1 twin-arginine translocase TatA/TatE family subunit [Blastocatellia bacterium]MDW8167746.1 twin-arginine translocase TatA/TatE family subunit [Acidobacteriota bacterium]MDW8256786.1 twin-arginine translocase TatA/TatE family subunit [Acidobacteriota bacterium]